MISWLPIKKVFRGADQLEIARVPYDAIGLHFGIFPVSRIEVNLGQHGAGGHTVGPAPVTGGSPRRVIVIIGQQRLRLAEIGDDLSVDRRLGAAGQGIIDSIVGGNHQGHCSVKVSQIEIRQPSKEVSFPEPLVLMEYVRGRSPRQILDGQVDRIQLAVHFRPKPGDAAKSAAHSVLVEGDAGGSRAQVPQLIPVGPR